MAGPANPPEPFLSVTMEFCIPEDSQVSDESPRRRASWSKLTEQTAAEIRRRHAAGGITQKELGQEYGVHQSKISDVICGKTWTHKRAGVQKGHVFGPQSPEHIAKRAASLSVAKKGKRPSEKQIRAAAEGRRGKKRAYSPVKAEITRRKWAEGVYTKSFMAQRRFPYSDTLAMRSSWEVRAARYFDELSISWEYEPRKFRLPSGSWYWPDFYLPEYELYIEIKGYLTYAAQSKFDDFCGLGHHAEMIAATSDRLFGVELAEFCAQMLSGDITTEETA